MRKNKVITLALVTILGISTTKNFAQVGINTKTPTASLDILSDGNTLSTKNLLIETFAR